MDRVFYINQQFLIEPGSNAVTNLATNERTRLEARLMQLLCILVGRKQLTVTREELISTIWNNYGGGDEGLTQAISLLRKVLQDADKQLLQTVPKKGYLFNGTISYEAGKADLKTGNKKAFLSPRAKWIAGIFIILISGTAIVYFNTRTVAKTVATQKPVPYPDLAKEESSEENETNTIITKASDGTIYKLVVIGDRLPRFYINNHRIPEGGWDQYLPLINSLKKKLLKKR